MKNYEIRLLSLLSICVVLGYGVFYAICLVFGLTLLSNNIVAMVGIVLAIGVEIIVVIHVIKRFNKIAEISPEEYIQSSVDPNESKIKSQPEAIRLYCKNKVLSNIREKGVIVRDFLPITEYYLIKSEGLNKLKDDNPY